jgi:hypothetical protein
MLAGLENFTAKVVLEILPQDERAFVRIVVASCDKHMRDGQLFRTGTSRKVSDHTYPRRRRVLRIRL